jgi:hypothetical protein
MKMLEGGAWRKSKNATFFPCCARWAAIVRRLLVG